MKTMGEAQRPLSLHWPQTNQARQQDFALYQGRASVREKSEKTPFFLKRATKPSS
jgi:hypothetical protein